MTDQAVLKYLTIGTVRYHFRPLLAADGQYPGTFKL